jgi:hypothetical protein
VWLSIHPSRGRGADFRRRALWYKDLDLELRHKTRFFGAAALTNRVLARLFEHFPKAVSDASATSLRRLGAQLERFNGGLAESVRQSPRHGAALDRYLVQAEQSIVEIHWRALPSERQQLIIGREINGLLNVTHVSCYLARLWRDSRDYCSVLSGLRARLCGPLNFAVESHRIEIGCALIEHLSRENGCASAMAAIGGHNP